MEMSVELIVFLGIGMLLLGIITTFVLNFGVEDDVNSLLTVYKDEGIKDQVKLSKSEFINAAKDYWLFCNKTYFNQTKSYYVFNDKEEIYGNLTKIDFFDQIKILGFCKSIQSKNMSCGIREDVNITNITLPKVIRLNCTNTSLFIS